MTEQEHDELHIKLVGDLCKPAHEIKSSLNSLDCHLIHMIMGICGEAGELLDSVKKSVIYREELDIENIVEELGDLEFYMQGLRLALDIKRKTVLEHNIQKLRKRYGKSYSNQAAQERADKS